jgi:hypothetical protein
MPSLRELQRGFSAAAIFGDTASALSLGILSDGLGVPERLAVYRNNIFGNYRRVLAATYPVVKRLVGAPFFDAASDQFVRAHPSAHGDVNRYGDEFGPFLGGYAPARELKYLSDVARLEWAIDQAAIADDAALFDLKALAAVPAEKVSSLRFLLHPSARLLASPFPVFHIWQVNQAGHDGDDRVDLGEGGDTLLVLRGAGGVTVERVPPGEHALLTALAANATLGEAVPRAQDVDTTFDLTDALHRHVANHTIVALRVTAGYAPESNP